MSRFYRLDVDLNGTDSIQSYIDSGKVINLECPTFDDFDKHRMMLMPKIEPGDTVMLDTVSKMLSTIRTDRVVGTKINEPLNDPKIINRFFGDKEYLAIYNYAAQLTMRALNNFRARGARVIVLAHEDEVNDQITGMKSQGPMVNPAMVGELIASSSDVFRLVSLTEPVVDAEGKTVFARDTRVLYLRRSDSFQAKFHVERSRSESIPKALPDPTLPKLWTLLGKQSSWLTVYGHPGAGKTSLGCTATDNP